MSKKSKIISIISLIISICIFVFGLILVINYKNNVNNIEYKRDKESYYHYKKTFGYIEIYTDKNIDVENCYVNIINFFGDEDTEKLNYQGMKNGYYVFEIFNGDYIFLGVNIVDEDGKQVVLKQYKESQEQDRLNKFSSIKSTKIIGIILSIVGIIATILTSCIYFALRHSKTTNTAIDKPNEPPTTTKENKTCKYCGSENPAEKLKCINCGANLKTKKTKKV